MAPELTNTPALTLEARVVNRQRLSAMKKEIDKQIDAESAAIKDEMINLGVETVDMADWVPVLSVRTRESLDKTELISLGVSTDIIQKATKTNEYMQLDVREKKQ